MSDIDGESCVDYNIDNKIFTIHEEPEDNEKIKLYKIIGPDKDAANPVFDIAKLKKDLLPYRAIANLTASRIIYKTHIPNRNCAVPAPPPTTLSSSSSSSSGVKLPIIPEGKGGKRTKRRRGRGKSKKKVTRKKRVKRRKTVKKIKRKRRTTRKR